MPRMRIIGKIYLILAIAIVGGGIFFFIFRDKEKPELKISPDSATVSQRPVTVDLQDERSGLRSLDIVLIQKDKEFPILSKQYPDRPRRIAETFTLDAAKIVEGDFTLRLSAKDGAFLFANALHADLPLTFDKTPPAISVLGRTHNIRQGGSAMVAYSLSESPSTTGIKIGNLMFPAFLQPSGTYLCLFPFPHDLDKGVFKPMIFAEDVAGNRSEAGFYYYARSGRFRQDRLNISDQFLNAKMPQFRNEVPDAATPLDIFLKVNKELRVKNEEELYRHGRNTAPSALFVGAFSRQPGKTMATFGDRRSYFHRGKQIDSQTHLGVDIASFAQAPIKAANHGRVIFTGFYGIYGECVIIDHGLGLQSLYGHLSRIDVTEGQDVAQDAVIGLSGATGMAGGDHLHFGMLVSGTPVDPIEWWDPEWVKNNIEEKLAEAGLK